MAVKKMKDIKKMIEDDTTDAPTEGRGVMNDEPEDKYCEEAVEEAMETLIEADQIKKDIKLMGLIQALARKTGESIKSIQDIKDRYVKVSITTPESDLLKEDGSLEAKVKADDGSDND
jgi:hypothetical protein